MDVWNKQKGACSPLKGDLAGWVLVIHRTCAPGGPYIYIANSGETETETQAPRSLSSGEQPPFCLFRTSMYPTFPSGRQKPSYSGLVGFSEKPLFWPLVEPKASSA